MKNCFLSILAFLILSCSSNTEVNDVTKTIEETSLESNTINDVAEETASEEDSIAEPLQKAKAARSKTDTTNEIKETMDPRIQRILDEKLTQEMKDSLRNTKSGKR